LALVLGCTAPLAPADEGWLGKAWRSAQFWNRETPAEPRARKPKPVRGARLQIEGLNPAPSLADTRRLEIQVRLTNRSRHGIRLEFPTTQHVEVVLRDAAREILWRWSEDRVFDREPTMLTLNPGESALFPASVPTRGMRPGQTCSLEAGIPGHEGLRVSAEILPSE
jgi:hypothetical protein